jgi:hypothetical protein
VLENCSNLIDCESLLSPRVQEISLLGQIVLLEDDFNKLGNLISKVMEEFDPPIGTAALYEIAPTSFCCFLVWTGILNYQAGDYWSSVHKLAKLPKLPIWQTRWGELFLRYLQTRSLPTFSDVGGHRYVTPILAHGGIPDYCLADFFKNLLFPIISGRLGMDLTDAEEILQEWQDFSALFMFTDKPVRRFLLHGGKAAADFLSRCIEMAQRTYEEGEVPGIDEIGIPPRIVQRFELWWQSAPGKVYPRQRGPHFRRPIIFLAPEFGEIYVQIPQQTIENDADGIPLRVEIIEGREKTTQQVLRCYERNGLIETEEAQNRLLSAAEKYELRLLRGNSILRTWSFSGITKERPWVAFEGGTKRIIQNEELPQAPVWLIFPKAWSISCESTIIEKGQEFYGNWSKYQVCLVDITPLKEIRLFDEEGSSITIPIASEKTSEAELVGGDLLPGGLCEGGPIYTSPPSLRIPSAEQLSRWRLSIVPQGNTTLETRRDHSLADIKTCYIDEKVIEIPLSEKGVLGSDVAGRFLIRLRGPLGKDTRHHIAILPGIKANFDKPIYVPIFEKAPDAKLIIETDSNKNILVEPPCDLIDQLNGHWFVKVPETESRARCTFFIEGPGSRRAEVPISFQVPRLLFSIQGLKEQSIWQWSNVPIEIPLEQLEESDEIFFLVETHGLAKGRATIALHGSNQEIPQLINKGKVRFDLKRFSDTVKALEQPVTYFYLNIESIGTSLKNIPALLLRTQWVVGQLDNDQETRDGYRFIILSWTDKGRVRNRVARLWRVWQPWVLPVQLNIPDGKSEILIEQPKTDLPPGQYHIEFSITDPWIGTPPVGLPPELDGKRVFELFIGDDDERLNYQTNLGKTFQTKLEQLAQQRSTKIKNLGEEINRISLEEPLTEIDLQAMAALLVSWLPESGVHADHVGKLWRHILWLHNHRLGDHSFAVRFLINLAIFAKDRAMSVKERAKRLCLLIGLTQTRLNAGPLNVDESERNAVWDLWHPLGLFLELSCPGSQEPDRLSTILTRVFGEIPLKDILNWHKVESVEWASECSGSFSECLSCRLVTARQCNKQFELNYSQDYYGGNETNNLDLLIAKEEEDLRQILGSLQLYPVGLLHKDAYVDSIANWVLLMKREDSYFSHHHWVSNHLNLCKTSLAETFKLEGLNLLANTLWRRLPKDHQNEICGVPFVIGSISLIQRLMANGLHHPLGWEEWKQLGTRAYYVAPQLYEHDLCLFDLSLKFINRSNQVSWSMKA